LPQFSLTNKALVFRLFRFLSIYISLDTKRQVITMDSFNCVHTLLLKVSNFQKRPEHF